MRMPAPDPSYPDAEVVWSEEFPDEGVAVGVWVADHQGEAHHAVALPSGSRPAPYHPRTFGRAVGRGTSSR